MASTDKEIEKLQMRIATLEALNEDLERENDELTEELAKYRNGEQKPVEPEGRPFEGLEKRDAAEDRRFYEEYLRKPPGIVGFDLAKLDQIPIPEPRKVEVPIEQSVVLDQFSGDVRLSMWYRGAPKSEVVSYNIPRGARGGDWKPLLREATAYLMRALVGTVVDEIVEQLAKSFHKETVKQGLFR